MLVKAVIFDLDGTVADTLPLTLYAMREAVREFTGFLYSDSDILEKFGPVDTDIVRDLVNSKDRDASVEAYIRCFEKNFDAYIKPIEGIDRLLEFLKANEIKVGLFTGRGMRLAKIILEKLKIIQYFDEVLTGDSTTNPKPDPEGILKVLAKLDVKASESIYVGDFDVDIRASKEAGTLSVLALWSSMASDKLIDSKPFKYFRKTGQFVEWLKNEIQLNKQMKG